MVFNYSFTDQAKNNLYEILDYLTNHLFNKKAAKDFYEKFENKINQICIFPYSEPIVENIIIDAHEVRKAKVKKYYVYYYVNKKNKLVVIICIRHILEDKKITKIS